MPPDDRIWTEGAARSYGVASIVALGFAALLGALEMTRAASDVQRAAADPLVQLLPPHAGVWIVVAFAIVVAMLWRKTLRLGRADALWLLAGAAAAAIAVLALHAIVGSRLPSFIPTEESARPGVTLGLAAGLLEEIIFRLGVLPGVLFAAAKRMPRGLAESVAVIVTSGLFALSHELGPGAAVFHPAFLLTRFLVPGVAMTVIALRVNVAFLVSAHCTAHLLIPALFTG